MLYMWCSFVFLFDRIRIGWMCLVFCCPIILPCRWNSTSSWVIQKEDAFFGESFILRWNFIKNLDFSMIDDMFYWDDTTYSTFPWLQVCYKILVIAAPSTRDPESKTDGVISSLIVTLWSKTFIILVQLSLFIIL